LVKKQWAKTCLGKKIKSRMVPIESRLELIRCRNAHNEIDLSTGAIQHRADCDMN
jgi:hypothetical protein